MQARILLVVEPPLSDLLHTVFRSEGMEVACGFSADEGCAEIARTAPQVIVFDGETKEGMYGLRRLRAATCAPIVVLSSSGSEEDMVRVLETGADAFVTKPFSPRVLVARVRALLRCAAGTKGDGAFVRFGEFVLDLEFQILKWRGRRVHLSAKEFDVLSFLASHPEATMTPEVIHAAVWRERFCDLSAVSVYVQRLRKKIERDPGAPRFIETVHGHGYRFIPNPEQAEKVDAPNAVV
jgi:DNA-binding response OmpR family regulator